MVDVSSSPNCPRRRAPLLGAQIDAVSWDTALDTVADWADQHQSRYVCFCNVHAVVSGRQDSALERGLAEADLALADGMPVAWMLRHTGFPDQARISGPDFMWRLCALAEQRGERVFFFGSTPRTLAALRRRLRTAFPGLHIAGMAAPPFRPMCPDEDAAAVARINASGAGVVFVGLGCPKQELWMAEHRGRVQAVMLGVGAAFDYHAGKLRRAPPWMQNHGLEWLHRLVSEPRRLWRRYLVTNSLFVLAALRELLVRKASGLLLAKGAQR